MNPTTKTLGLVLACIAAGCASSEARRETAVASQSSSGSDRVVAAVPAQPAPEAAPVQRAQSSEELARPALPEAMSARTVRADEVRPAADEEPSDGELMAVLTTMARSEVEQGNLARSRASHAQVRSLGAALASANARSTEQLSGIARRENVAPRETLRSREIAQDSEAIRQRLTGLRGEVFDRAYVEGLAMQHQRVLEILDGPLVAGVRSAQLRDAINQSVRPAVAENLERARALQADLQRR